MVKEHSAVRSRTGFERGQGGGGGVLRVCVCVRAFTDEWTGWDGWAGGREGGREGGNEGRRGRGNEDTRS